MVQVGTTMIRSSVAHAQLTEVVEHALPASICIGRGKYRLLVLLVIYRDGESCNYFRIARVWLAGVGTSITYDCSLEVTFALWKFALR